MDWFPWYPEKYRNKTLHLTCEQDGMYRRLIDYYMESRKPLPNNDNALARICGVELSCFCSASALLKEYFKQNNDGTLSHIMCDNMLDEQDDKARFRSDRGKKGADARNKKRNENNEILASSKAQAPLKLATVDRDSNSRESISKDIIVPEGISDQLWSDFKAHRKAKKAPITQTALKGIINEAAKAGISLETALETIVSRGWTGLKAEWVKDQPHDQRNSNNRKPLTGHAVHSAAYAAASAQVEQDRLQGKTAPVTEDDEFWRNIGSEDART